MFLNFKTECKYSKVSDRRIGKSSVKCSIIRQSKLMVELRVNDEGHREMTHEIGKHGILGWVMLDEWCSR